MDYGEWQPVTAHALLPGCQVPWRHDDCPGIEASANASDELIVGGGLVCHCPCHSLKRELEEMRTILRAVSSRRKSPWRSPWPPRL